MLRVPRDEVLQGVNGSLLQGRSELFAYGDIPISGWCCIGLRRSVHLHWCFHNRISTLGYACNRQPSKNRDC